MKRLRLASLGLLILSLLSCDVFLAPIQGRWNPLDPQNELLVLYPTIDGHAAAGWVDTEAFLTADPGTSSVVLRFNEGDLPDSMEEPYLKISMITAPGAGVTIKIHRIISDWAVPITYSDTIQADIFYDASNWVAHTVSPTAGWESIPLEKILGGSKDNAKYGIVIFAPVYLDFDSMRTVDSSLRPYMLVHPN